MVMGFSPRYRDPCLTTRSFSKASSSPPPPLAAAAREMPERSESAEDAARKVLRLIGTSSARNGAGWHLRAGHPARQGPGRWGKVPPMRALKQLVVYALLGLGACSSNPGTSRPAEEEPEPEPADTGAPATGGKKLDAAPGMNQPDPIPPADAAG